jgi:hypothetical protein
MYAPHVYGAAGAPFAVVSSLSNNKRNIIKGLHNTNGAKRAGRLIHQQLCSRYSPVVLSAYPTSTMHCVNVQEKPSCGCEIIK